MLCPQSSDHYCVAGVLWRSIHSGQADARDQQPTLALECWLSSPPDVFRLTNRTKCSPVGSRAFLVLWNHTSEGCQLKGISFKACGRRRLWSTAPTVPPNSDSTTTKAEPGRCLGGAISNVSA